MKTLRSPRGLTLVEVLVAIVLLAVGAAAVGSLMGGSYRQTNTNLALSHAVDVATQEMEELRAMDYATLASRNPPATVWTGLTFSVQSTVTRDTPAANMSTLGVAVSWNQRGRPYSYRLQSIYADTRN